MMLSVPRLSRLPGTASILAEAIAAQAVARVESGERGGSRGAVAAGASTAGTSVGIRGDRDDEGVRLLEPERLARPARGRTGRVDGARGASQPARALVFGQAARGAETGRRRAGQDAQPGPVGCGAADVFGRRREVVAQASSRCEYHRQDACATKTYRQDAWATDFQRGNERLCHRGRARERFHGFSAPGRTPANALSAGPACEEPESCGAAGDRWGRAGE